MVANLVEDEGKDQEEQEDQFDRADLMAGSLGIAGGDQDEVSIILVASMMDSSNANPDTSAIENNLSEGGFGSIHSKNKTIHSKNTIDTLNI